MTLIDQEKQKGEEMGLFSTHLITILLLSIYKSLLASKWRAPFVRHLRGFDVLIGRYAERYADCFQLRIKRGRVL